MWLLTDNSALGICDRLISKAELITAEGRILFTDNWYTSIDLAKHLLFKYHWLFVGTIAPSKKKSRSGYDIPFLKLSKPSLDKLCRGWSRRATIEVKESNNKGFVQCTNWKDRKQVLLLHTHAVEPTMAQSTTNRRVKGQRAPTIIQCPPVIKEYSKNGYNAVDRDDCDSADYTVSIRTNRWYLRKWFWTIDRANRCTYLCVKHLVEDGNKDQWKQYLDKHGGRKKFQIDLALQLMDHAIRLDWNGDISDHTGRPRWMRQKPFLPCSCQMCFFCKNGWTGGIYHSPQRKKAGRKKMAPVCNGKYEKMPYQRYCGPCYRRYRELHPNKTTRESQRNVPCPVYGCVTCENVCKQCWPTYEHKYEVLK